MNDGIYTVSQYIQSKCTLRAKIDSIDALIEAMELKILDATESAAYDEYQMDDGQMKVRTKYRSVKDVMVGISGLEMLKQQYVNRYNGRNIVFRGGNF
jgi:hypothetical protein